MMTTIIIVLGRICESRINACFNFAICAKLPAWIVSAYQSAWRRAILKYSGNVGYELSDC